MRTRFARIVAAGVVFTGLGLVLGGVSLPSGSVEEAPALYKVDGVHSSNVFRIKHNNVANFYGRFKETGGTVNWDDSDPGLCSIKVEIPVASVDTGVAARDNHLKSPDFFNAAQFPMLTFTSTSFSKSGDNAYKVSGDLSVHGVTKPITVDLLKTGAGKDSRSGKDLLGLESIFTIKRTDFGMDYGVSNNGLGDEVQFTIALEAVKQ